MRILIVGDFGGGGVKRHAECLTECLPLEVDRYTIGVHEPFAAGSGHSLKVFLQIRRVMKVYRPDVVHLHKLQLMMCLYLKFFSRVPRIVSLHCSYFGKLHWRDRIVQWLLRPAYYLPVSQSTWDGYRRHYPKAQGEVFYNPVKIDRARVSYPEKWEKSIGMAGRNAAIKDWPSFCRVASLLHASISESQAIGIGVTPEQASVYGSDRASVRWTGQLPEARSTIAKLGAYVLTSVSEQMPTVVLECFAERTPICGFIPKGGLEEILAFSNGALREVFVENRDCDKVAEIARRLLTDAKLRGAVIEDGWQILTQHFDAERICRGRLVEIYNMVVHGEK